MQHIDIVLTDEKSNIIENSDINFVPILELIQNKSDHQFTFLSTIDPYGDTVFNKLQKGSLIEELAFLQKEASELTETISKIIDFVEKANDHQYIKFIGD